MTSLPALWQTNQSTAFVRILKIKYLKSEKWCEVWFILTVRETLFSHKNKNTETRTNQITVHPGRQSVGSSPSAQKPRLSCLASLSQVRLGSLCCRSFTCSGKAGEMSQSPASHLEQPQPISTQHSEGARCIYEVKIHHEPTVCCSRWSLLLAGWVAAAPHGVDDPCSRFPGFWEQTNSLSPDQSQIINLICLNTNNFLNFRVLLCELSGL